MKLLSTYLVNCEEVGADWDVTRLSPIPSFLGSHRVPFGGRPFFSRGSWTSVQRKKVRTLNGLLSPAAFLLCCGHLASDLLDASINTRSLFQRRSNQFEALFASGALGARG
jgi:hypothetical protein